MKGANPEFEDTLDIVDDMKVSYDWELLMK